MANGADECRTVPTSLAALAAGVSEATIRKWASRGKISRFGRPGRAEYDVRELIEIVAARRAVKGETDTTVAAGQGCSTSGGPASLTDRGELSVSWAGACLAESCRFTDGCPCQGTGIAPPQGNSPRRTRQPSATQTTMLRDHRGRRHQT